MVQYEAMFSGTWHEIVRYDCAHGFFHRDIMYPKGKNENLPIMIEHLNNALQYAEQDIRDRWSWHKERYKRRANFKTREASFRRKPESSLYKPFGTQASADVTDLGRFEIGSFCLNFPG
jgi:hypothetical protein